MKYIKKFENTIKQNITISLLELCDYFGGMFNAVEKLIILNRHCDFYTFYTKDTNYHNIHNKIEHYIIKTKYSDTKEDYEAILFDGSVSYSYGYIKTQNYDVIIEFHNVESVEEDIQLFISTKKYNL
jgi:hypothetical protein